MAQAIDTLQAVFENAECKLNSVICNIEKCFAIYESTQATLNDSDDQNQIVAKNPTQLLSEMKTIVSELEEIKQEHEQISQLEKDVAAELEEARKTAATEIQTVLKSLQ